jgi:hypothetical protein
MSTTATQLRKQLFTMLDAAADGTPIEFTYKGKQMQIIAETGTSKLARLQPQAYTAVSEEEMELAASDFKDQLQADWLAKWEK